jgi:3-hydroxyisobutyrate dehydrogenase
MTRRTAWGQHGFSTRFALGRTDLKRLLPGQTGRIASLTYRRPPGRNWRCQEELPAVAGVQAPGISRALQARRPIRAGRAGRAIVRGRGLYRACVLRIGFIGVGSMGLPMCANLVRAGYEVTAGDLRAELEEAVIGCGARWRPAAAGVAADADVLITVLPGPGEVHDVMAGRDGALSALPAAAAWIDMTSSSPAVARVLTAEALARGLAVLEAPMGGGVQAARDGTLQLFVGGDLALLDRLRPILEVLARPDRITHVGGHGAGYLTKLLVNLLWFGQAIATAEALLARSAGLDLDVVREALAGSAASSAFIRDDLSALFDGDYLTSFGLDRCCEELASVTALARENDVPAGLAAFVDATYRRALRRYGRSAASFSPLRC